MSALPKSTEIKRVMKAVKDSGFEIATIKVLADGVIMSVKGEKSGVSAYDQWKAQSAN